MTSEARKRRKYRVSELARVSGSFGDDSTKMIAELRAEIGKDGTEALFDHLRVCGAMPELYGHDSSEEKLYSKYTDAVISESLTAIGLKSAVITARADAADVQARGGGYSLVADAKAFRLSRTAKNQKDFKVQAMAGATALTTPSWSVRSINCRLAQARSISRLLPAMSAFSATPIWLPW